LPSLLNLVSGGNEGLYLAHIKKSSTLATMSDRYKVGNVISTAKGAHPKGVGGVHGSILGREH
jgi:hypothetical protein